MRLSTAEYLMECAFPFMLNQMCFPLHNCGVPRSVNTAQNAALFQIGNQFYYRGQGGKKFVANYRVPKNLKTVTGT